jgi:E3 ubiquitin-protein ligase HERC4
MSGLHNSRVIEYVVRTIDLFNEANDQRELKDRIHFKEFHNDAINKEVSLKDHFIVWIREREQCKREGRPFDRHKTFTLCSHPWILDASNKSELLRIQNKLEQDQNRFNNINDLLLNPGMGAIYLMLEVRREHVLEDTLRKIISGNINFKKPLRVMFEGEPGIDEGGVKKEFF